MSLPAVYFVRLECQEKALHVGRLTEKHFNRGQHVLIVVADDDIATALDRYLWTWKKDSFLPHKVINTSGESCDEAIVISTVEHNPHSADVLICVSPCSPAFFKDFNNVYDFAETYDSQLADAARDRFRLYRQHGYVPQMESTETSD